MNEDVLMNFLIKKDKFYCPYCNKKTGLVTIIPNQKAYKCRTRKCKAYGYWLYSIEKDGVLREFNLEDYQWNPPLPDDEEEEEEDNDSDDDFFEEG